MPKPKRQVLYSHETAPATIKEGGERISEAIKALKVEGKPITFLSLGVRAGYLKVVKT